MMKVAKYLILLGCICTQDMWLILFYSNIINKKLLENYIA